VAAPVVRCRVVRSGYIVVFCVAAAVGGAPAIAGACSSGFQVTGVVPESGEHPANAAVIVRGTVAFEDSVSATIDGVPVTVVLDEALSYSGSIEPGDTWNVLALRFEPEPLPGQTVVVDGVPCEDGPEACPPYHVEYVAGEPDLEIADDMPVVGFDLLRFTSIIQNSCGTYGSVVDTHVDVADDAWEDESFVLLEVRAFHEGLGVEDVRRRVAESSSGWHYLDTTLVGDAFPLDGWCVDVTPRDAAGNEGPTVSTCDACMYLEADDAEDGTPLMPIPGGPCDVSSTTSSGGAGDTSSGAADTSSSGDAPPDPPADSDPPSDDDTTPPDDDDTSGAPAQDDGVDDRGCACTSSASPPPFALLLLGLLGLVRRRASSRAS
jgi:MYXO-CTERM domain-containing protein